MSLAERDVAAEENDNVFWLTTGERLARPRLAHGAGTKHHRDVSSFETAANVVRVIAPLARAKQAWLRRDGSRLVLTGPQDEPSFDRGSEVAYQLAQVVQAMMWPDRTIEVMGEYRDVVEGEWPDFVQVLP